MLLPKRVKYRRVHRGRLKGKECCFRRELSTAESTEDV